MRTNRHGNRGRQNDKRHTLLLGVALAFNGACSTTDDGSMSLEETGELQSELRSFLDRTEAVSTSLEEPPPTPVRAPNGILYWGGDVMHGAEGTNVYLIWYGAWDANQKNGIRNFVSDASDTAYWDINASYYQADGHRATKYLNFGGESAIGYTKGRALEDRDIFAIVKDEIDARRLPPDEAGVYFVLTARDVAESDPWSSFCGEGGRQEAYCAHHGSGSYRSRQFGSYRLKYSFVGDPARCPDICMNSVLRESPPSGNSTADATINILAHQLSEMVTDPTKNAWHNSSSRGSGDLCRVELWQPHIPDGGRRNRERAPRLSRLLFAAAMG
jgi:hypothetical protein